MKTLAELKPRMDDFWELEEAQQNDLLADIREYADASNPDTFRKEVRSTFALKHLSPISIVYDALSVEPEKWRTFFVEEYERAFQSAENAENAFEILDCLEEIGFSYKYLQGDFHEIISLLSKYLSSNNKVLQYKAIWYLGDWIDENNAARYGHVITALEEKLNDPHWKIRYITRTTLEDMKQLPAGYAEPFLDKLRRRFGNPGKM